MRKTILEILTDWNPLDVPNEITQEEYSSYVPILEHKDKAEIYEWLENFIKETFCIDRINSCQKKELEMIANDIYAAI